MAPPIPKSSKSVFILTKASTAFMASWYIAGLTKNSTALSLFSAAAISATKPKAPTEAAWSRKSDQVYLDISVFISLPIVSNIVPGGSPGKNNLFSSYTSSWERKLFMAFFDHVTNWAPRNPPTPNLNKGNTLPLESSWAMFSLTQLNCLYPNLLNKTNGLNLGSLKNNGSFKMFLCSCASLENLYIDSRVCLSVNLLEVVLMSKSFKLFSAQLFLHPILLSFAFINVFKYSFPAAADIYWFALFMAWNPEILVVRFANLPINASVGSSPESIWNTDRLLMPDFLTRFLYSVPFAVGLANLYMALNVL